VYIVRCSRTLI